MQAKGPAAGIRHKNLIRKGRRGWREEEVQGQLCGYSEELVLVIPAGRSEDDGMVCGMSVRWRVQAVKQCDEAAQLVVGAL